MSSPQAANVCNGYLSVNPASNLPSARGRSASVTPSERSSRSRITVVDDDPELASYHGPETHDSYKNASKVYVPRHSWFEHLLGLFFINVAKRKEQKIKLDLPEEPEVAEMDVDEGSPWILPVYVLSSRKDTDKQRVPKEAKCTIDTGNHQGNIVSQDFVLDVLQLPEANFRPLTKEEEKGATGITDHKLVPVAAIYLTWYHKKSTRVFHDMRFLISPYQHYDLIIGARSIREHKLLDVPNLMANDNGHLSRTSINGGSQDEVLKGLDDKKYEASKHFLDLKSQLKKDTQNGDDTTIIKTQLVEAKEKLDAAQKALDEYKSSVASHSLPKASAAKNDVPVTNGSSQSSGIDKEATKNETRKRGGWSLRSRDSQA